MASYWTRKDDQSGETTTLYPWQEEIGGGDKEFPEPPDGDSSPGKCFVPAKHTSHLIPPRTSAFSAILRDRRKALS